MLKLASLNSLFLVFWSFTTMSCVTKTFTFKSGSNSKVSLVSATKLDEDGTLLGETPVTVPLDKLTGKIVKISQKGKQPIYWVVTDAAGDKTEANIKLLDDLATAGGLGGSDSRTDPKLKLNRVMRLLMRSYQALSGKRFKDARELAEQAGTIDPEIAAPQVIRGLAFYQEGNKSEARAALAKAQALDPEDKEIENLLKMVR